MAQPETTDDLGYQNFFSTELTSGVTAADTTIPLNALPTPDQGFLVLEPDSSANREIIFYTSKTSTAVICPDATARGIGGTSARSHSQNSTVKMNITAEHFLSLQDGTAFNFAGENYTPSLAGTGGSPTLGDGTLTGQTIRIGKLRLFKFKLTVGSTTVFPSSITRITLPSTPNSASFDTRTLVGRLEYLDASPSAAYLGDLAISLGTDAVDLYVTNTSSTYAAPTNVSSSVPVTPATGDIIRGSGWYIEA